MLARMPAALSVGWLGCRRTASEPGRPSVLRKRVTTRQRLATRIRSWLRMILLAAAAISGVSPGASAASDSGVAASDSSQSRRPPTVRWRTGANAAASWLSTIRRVTSSLSYGTTACDRNVASGTSASAACAATRSCAVSRGDAGEPVARAQRARLAHQLAQIGEAVDLVTDRGAIAHAPDDTCIAAG